MSDSGPKQPPIPSEFPALQRMSFEELKLKTEAHRRGWGIDQVRQWNLSQDTGELIFSLDGGITASTPAQIIGTFNTEDNTWLWAWDNPSIVDALKTDALKLRQYGEEHHIEKLTQPEWQGTETEAWVMTALAVKLCSEQGAYRGPAGTTLVFMAFGNVTLRPKR